MEAEKSNFPPFRTVRSTCSAECGTILISAFFGDPLPHCAEASATKSSEISAPKSLEASAPKSSEVSAPKSAEVSVPYYGGREVHSEFACTSSDSGLSTLQPRTPEYDGREVQSGLRLYISGLRTLQSRTPDFVSQKSAFYAESRTPQSELSESGFRTPGSVSPESNLSTVFWRK